MPTDTELKKKALSNIERIERLLQTANELQRETARLLAALDNGSPAAEKTATPPMEDAILTALAACARVKVSSVPRQWLSVIAGVSPKSGPYNSALAKLQKAGMVRKAGIGAVTLATTRQYIARPDGPLLTTQELMKRAEVTLGRHYAAILHALACHLFDSKNDWMDRGALAQACGQSATSSLFRDRLTDLRKYGFIAYGQNLTVRIHLDWFKPAMTEYKA